MSHVVHLPPSERLPYVHGHFLSVKDVKKHHRWCLDHIDEVESKTEGSSSLSIVHIYTHPPHKGLSCSP